MPIPILVIAALSTSSAITSLVGRSYADKMAKEAYTKGMKEGYSNASKEWEQKFRELTEYFMNERKVTADKFAEYEELLRMYEELIKELERKQSKSKNEVQALKEIKVLYNELVNLEKCS